eukprot:COSAG01_NODE_7930_length_2987_cov_100.025277_2_plen_108_part_00
MLVSVGRSVTNTDALRGAAAAVQLRHHTHLQQLYLLFELLRFVVVLAGNSFRLCCFQFGNFCLDLGPDDRVARAGQGICAVAGRNGRQHDLSLRCERVETRWRRKVA